MILMKFSTLTILETNLIIYHVVLPVSTLSWSPTFMTHRLLS